MSWRRPIYRWNWRMLRRESKQWSLVVAMIASAVAVAISLAASVYNAAPLPTSPELGNANNLIGVSGAASDRLIDDARSAFDVADLVERATVQPRGFSAPIEVRAFDPDGANSGALVGLVDGRLPATDDEVAITPRRLERLGGEIGDIVEFERFSFVVSGTVENPLRLSDEFVFALPGAVPPDETRLLVSASDDEVDRFLEANDDLFWLEFADDARSVATVVVTLLAGLVFLEVALLVVSIVTMLAQRRAGQLSLLAAAGANRRQLRAAVVSGGAIAASIGTTIGVLVGLGLARLFVPTLDGLADRRLDSVVWPWSSIVVIAAIAVVTTLAATWWPARRITGSTVDAALRSGRPDDRRPITMTLVGATLVVAGVAGLIATFSLDDTDRPIFVDAAAFLAVPLGAVLLAPAAVRAWVALAPTPSLSARVAARDIGRFPSRSAATAAALVVVLAVPVIGAAGFRIFERSPENVASMPPELVLLRPDNPLDGTIGVEPFEPGDQAALGDDVVALAGSAEAIPLLQPIVETGGDGPGPIIVESGPFGGTADTSEAGFREPLVFGTVTDQEGGNFGIELAPTYVGTPELVAALGLDAIGDADVVTNREGPHGIVQYLERDVGLDQTMRVEIRAFERFDATPGALLSPAYAESLDASIETTGWLIRSDSPITDAEIARIADGAAALGLVVEAHEPASDGRTTVLIMLVVSLLFAIGIVAVVGALHRAETAPTHAAFEAAGASRRFRRSVHAWTMASLTAIAAVLAVAAGLLSQLGFASEVLGTGRILESIPPATTAAVLLLAPALAYAFGWWTGRPAGSGTDLVSTD